MMGPGFAAAAITSWLEPLGVLIFSIVLLFVLSMGGLWYITFQSVAEREAFQKVCIDAGGLPVTTYTYIKGSKDGHLCINPSAIIEVK